MFLCIDVKNLHKVNENIKEIKILKHIFYLLQNRNDYSSKNHALYEEYWFNEITLIIFLNTLSRVFQATLDSPPTTKKDLFDEES
jgi:hypothetical protein